MILKDNIGKIIFIENRSRRTYVVGEKGEILVNEPFSKMSEILALQGNFLKSHQSFMVNTNYVKSFNETEVVLEFEDRLYKVHMSRRKYREFKDKIKQSCR